MNNITSVNDIAFFCRLDEIEGELQDFHISSWRVWRLTEEKKEIVKELRNRGYLKKKG